MIVSSTDCLVLRTLALDVLGQEETWEEALDAFSPPDGDARWKAACEDLVRRKLLERLLLGNCRFPPVETYRLTPDGWEVVDFAHNLTERRIA